MVELGTHISRTPTDTYHVVSFVRPAYTPRSILDEGIAMRVSEERRTVRVRCRSGQTVKQVIKYHYRGATGIREEAE